VSAQALETRGSSRRPGRVAGWTVRDGRTLVVDLGGAALSVTPLGPGTAHVRASATGEFLPRRPWAPTTRDEALPAPAPDVVEDDDLVVAVLPEMSVAVGDGGIVSVVDAAGRPLLVDGDGGGPAWHDDGSSSWAKRMPAGERYYGFGERLGLLEKRGRRYTCWTTDEWRHQGPTTDSLYVAIPFFMGLANDGRAYGVLLDNTYRTTFDLTDLAGERMRWHAQGGDPDWFVFAGPSPARVVERLTEIVGRMPLPPRWALGYHQSRWGYESSGEILEVARQLRRRRIPADAVHLDIDHMSERRVFTFDEERFPDPAGLVGELDALGFETVAVVSACVKQEPGYAVYDSGHRGGVFLRGKSGDEFTAWVWPGRCVFPDHLRDDVRRWWGDRYRFYLDVGVRGFVNDMNEPAMHARPVDEPDSPNLEPPPDLVHGTHDRRATHAEVRNLYALLEAEGTYAYLRRARPSDRPFLLSRAGFAGIQRYAGTWTGDLSSVWEHLEASLPQILNLGLSGVPFAGADIGGFFENCGPELLVRWTQLGALMPFARNHSAEGTTDQEPWAWGDSIEQACRAAIELRYRLLPYTYTLFEEAARTGRPPLRPLLFHYPEDARTYDLSDQALLGPDLLLAPVLRPGLDARAVYFPEGRWTDLRDGASYLGPASSLVPAPLDQGIPLFARSGSIVPLGPVVESTRDYRLDPLELRVFPAADRAYGELYEDDGETLEHAAGRWCRTTYEYANGVLRTRRSSGYRPAERRVRVIVGEGTDVREIHDRADWEVEL
jgi:alpha-glucosidase